MFEKFTDRARQAVVYAQEEARLLNHNYIGTEHILLGLVQEGGGVGATALDSLGVSLENVRQRVEEIIGTGAVPPSGHVPFTPRAKKVLELALREALQLGHNFIGTEHLLLGLIREGEGVAAQVLVDLGADLGRARDAVLQIISGMPAEERKISERVVRRRGPWRFRGVTSDPARRSGPAGDEDDLGPNCPSCRERLAGTLTWERMEGVGEDTKRIPMVVVFCMDCGTTLGVLPYTEPIDAAASEAPDPSV
jgi:hypothetical protein